ncbi:MAG: hypothetical protein ACYCS7_13870 [Acidimicrobiales bacterium]
MGFDGALSASDRAEVGAFDLVRGALGGGELGRLGRPCPADGNGPHDHA